LRAAASAMIHAWLRNQCYEKHWIAKVHLATIRRFPASFRSGSLETQVCRAEIASNRTATPGVPSLWYAYH